MHPPSLIPSALFTARFQGSGLGAVAGGDLTELFYGADGLAAAVHAATGKATPKHRLLGWEVIYSTEQMDSFSVTLANPDLTLLDHPALQTDARWKIRFGVEGQLCSPFTCVVTQRQGWYQLTISGEMEAERKLTQTQQQQKWTRKRLSDVARDVIRQAGLVPVVDATKQLLPVVVRGNETAWQFLQRKAQETGLAYVVYAHGNKGYFVKQGTDKAPHYMLQLLGGAVESGGALAGLTAAVDGLRAMGQPDCMQLLQEPQLCEEQTNVATQETLQGFDPLAKKSFCVHANSNTSRQTLLAPQPAVPHAATMDLSANLPGGFGASARTGRGCPTSLPNKARAQDAVNSCFASKQLQGSCLSCTVLGSPSLVAGEVVMLQCPAAKTIAGRWLLQEVKHSCQDGSYVCELMLQRNASEPAQKSAQVATALTSRAPVNRKRPQAKPNERLYRFGDDGKLHKETQAQANARAQKQ